MICQCSLRGILGPPRIEFISSPLLDFSCICRRCFATIENIKKKSLKRLKVLRILKRRAWRYQKGKTLCQEELRIVVLLYADESIILSESAPNLQNSLDGFDSCYSPWKLSVNVEKKPKAFTFCKRRGGGQRYGFKLYLILKFVCHIHF